MALEVDLPQKNKWAFTDQEFASEAISQHKLKLPLVFPEFVGRHIPVIGSLLDVLPGFVQNRDV